MMNNKVMMPVFNFSELDFVKKVNGLEKNNETNQPRRY